MYSEANQCIAAAKAKGMLLEPEEWNSESCAVPVAMFRADRMPYTGTPRNKRMTQPTFAKHLKQEVMTYVAAIRRGRPSPRRHQSAGTLEFRRQLPPPSQPPISSLNSLRKTHPTHLSRKSALRQSTHVLGAYVLHECDFCRHMFQTIPDFLVTVAPAAFPNRGERRYKCEACGKQFHWAWDLAKHQRTHTDERPYKCQICEKMFRQAGHLDNHKRTHTDEKPYLCITCGKTYKSPSNLRKHERTHPEENRHACQKCAKSFENKYNLKRHVDTQCGNSAFICEICDRFYMTKSTLIRHRRTKHADKAPYDCTQCGCRFADQEIRDRHVCQKERRM
nr:zinc finger protein 554-like [Dermacentor andersoni]